MRGFNCWLAALTQRKMKEESVSQSARLWFPEITLYYYVLVRSYVDDPDQGGATTYLAYLEEGREDFQVFVHLVGSFLWANLLSCLVSSLLFF